MGYCVVLEMLVVELLLDLGLCLGEGIGVVLVLGFVCVVVEFYNYMVSFVDVGVIV